MEEALTAVILGDTAVAALVGDRVHWLRQPSLAVTFPFIGLRVVSGGDDYTLDGPSLARSGRVQLDIWAQTHAEAKAVERAVVALLSGYSGQVGATALRSVFVDGLREFSDTMPGGESALFRVSVDLVIGWVG